MNEEKNNAKAFDDETTKRNSSIENNGLFALTTFDNPYDPFTQFTDWLMFDNLKGYSTNCYLARIAHTSDQLSDEENNAEIERAIDEIIANDFLGIYKKVINNNYESI